MKAFVFLLLCSPAWACKLSSDSAYRASDEKLVRATDVIYVGRVLAKRVADGKREYDVRVERALKGEPIVGEVRTLKFEDRGDVATTPVSLASDCTLRVSLKVEDAYVVFAGANHEKAFAPASDAWRKRVEALVAAGRR